MFSFRFSDKREDESSSVIPRVIDVCFADCAFNVFAIIVEKKRMVRSLFITVIVVTGPKSKQDDHFESTSDILFQNNYACRLLEPLYNSKK